MKNWQISLILGAAGIFAFLLIPTVDILLNPGKYDGNAIAFGYVFGSISGLFIGGAVFGISYLILMLFRKGRKYK